MGMLGKGIALLKRVRIWILKITVWKRFDFGEYFHAGRSVVLWAPDELKIGKHVYIGRNSQVECNAVIGDYVIMANNVSLVGRYDHNYQQVGIPVRQAKQVRDADYDWKGKGLKVEIEDDVWIGYGVIILSGVKIGEGAVVAAGSVVTKDIMPYGIYAGSPAKKIADRFACEEDVLEHRKALAKLCNC